MAITMSESSTYTRITGTLAGLQYEAQNYDAFDFDLYSWNGSSWVYETTESEYPFDHYYSYSVSHTFTNYPPNTAYYVKGWAKYGGTWYGFTSGTWTTTTAIPVATFSNESTQKTTITFNYTNTVGAMSLYVYNGSTWVGIASSGIPYSQSGVTNGYTITLNTLVPNSSYYFYVRTYVESSDYYSIAPAGSPSYKTYTTTAWPTVGTAVTVASRYEGGYNLNWGDHSYEGSSFDYALKVDGGSSYYRYTDNSSQAFTTNDYGVSHSFQVCASKYCYGANGVYGWYVDTANFTSTNSYYTAPKRPGAITLTATTTKSFSYTASSMTANYSAVEWRYRINGSGSGFSVSTDYGGGLSVVLDNLVHNTTYEIQCYSYHGTSGLYSVDYRGATPTTTLLTVGSPTNVSVVQAGYTLSCDLFYSWGTNATGMDFRWSNDASTWNDYSNQTNNLYPSANYNVGIVAYGNKYFQVRSRRSDGYNVVTSSYTNASPYPITTVSAPPYRTKVYVGGSWVAKPTKVMISSTWTIKPVKARVGGSWI